jgi:thiol-disulfide isomerase/thioredoxin
LQAPPAPWFIGRRDWRRAAGRIVPVELIQTAANQDKFMMTTPAIVSLAGRIFLIPALVLCLQFSARGDDFPDKWTADDDAATRAEHAALEGKPMLPLDVSDWINGEVKPADMKGKVVLIDFYATWCAQCMEAIPLNNKLLKKYQDKGLVIVGVCTSKDGQEDMQATVKKRGMKYPTARDANLKCLADWHVDYYPTLALIDRKGIVRIVGLDPDRVEKAVKKLLAEPASAN